MNGGLRLNQNFDQSLICIVHSIIKNLFKGQIVLVNSIFKIRQSLISALKVIWVFNVYVNSKLEILFVLQNLVDNPVPRVEFQRVHVFGIDSNFENLKWLQILNSFCDFCKQQPNSYLTGLTNNLVADFSILLDDIFDLISCFIPLAHRKQAVFKIIGKICIRIFDMQRRNARHCARLLRL